MLNIRDGISASHSEDGEVSEDQTCVRDAEANLEKQKEFTAEAVPSEQSCISEDKPTQEVHRSDDGTNGHLTKQEPDGRLDGVGDGTSAKDQDKGTPGLVSGSLGKKTRGPIDEEWAVSSTAFIGPMCRPEATRSEGDLEEKLSEFYKELEQIKDADSSSSDKGESCVESKRPVSPAPRVEERFSFNRDSRPHCRPPSYWGPHCGDWQPWKRRRTHYGLEDAGWGPPYCQDHWQHPSLFVGPDVPGPRFRGPQFYEPMPCPPPPPPHPFYPPDFMSVYYNYPPAMPGRRQCEWQHPCPPGSEFTFYDGYDDHSSFQGYNDCPYPPYDVGNGQGNGCPEYSDAAWFVQQEQGGLDWNRGDGDNRPHQQCHPREECPPPPAARNDDSLLLILMRGLPGSGKSTLAQELLSSGPNGLVLSTDDYFSGETGYAYDPSLLGDAHDWNQNRARIAMDEGRSPVIIDNTNMQAWEMKPYAELAIERGYRVDFCEPNTSWKLDPSELQKRNKHGVPREKIAQMLERFELPISLDVVLNSQQPPHKSLQRSSPQLRPRPHDLKA